LIGVKESAAHLEPIQEVGIHFEGHGLVKRLSMMRIIARRMNALTVVA
jgi:hypothetical protein